MYLPCEFDGRAGEVQLRFFLAQLAGVGSQRIVLRLGVSRALCQLCQAGQQYSRACFGQTVVQAAAGVSIIDRQGVTCQHRAGIETGEKVWRMPLGKAYDKLIDSKTADMKNIGGRFAGSITGAQFIQRFVKDMPWAHLDVAGTAMDSNRNEINPSWASGWGVRLLDRLVSDNFEKGEK